MSKRREQHQGELLGAIRDVRGSANSPDTVERVVLACRTNAGRPMATVRTFDGREFGINGAGCADCTS
jgi:hypothetical protein